MKSAREDLPITIETPEGTIRRIVWGEMSVETADIVKDSDPAPFFEGLPGGNCPCAHWGYVVKGRMRFKYPDHEEVYDAGDVYYAPPGHLPLMEAGLVYVDFSPAAQRQETVEAVARNLPARK